MIVLETSALVAVITSEPGFTRMAACIETHKGEVILPVHCLLEAHMVLASRFPRRMVELLNALVAEIAPIYPPFTLDHAQVARLAFDRFGKGRHRAGLNFGDCMSYAVARVAGLALLYAGEDFAETDVVGV